MESLAVAALFHDLCKANFYKAKENGKTIFLSTHDLELTLQIADRIWLMQKGNITIGTPEEVAQSGALSEFIEREGITFDKSQMRVKISR